MDLKVLMDGSDRAWTEERHSLFLNWIEASFVRRMLGLRPTGGAASTRRRHHLEAGVRLDRPIPDSPTESTNDPRSPRPPLSDSLCESIASCMNPRKRTFALPDASARDQVLPEIESSENGDGATVSWKKKRKQSVK